MFPYPKSFWDQDFVVVGREKKREPDITFMVPKSRVMRSPDDSE